MGNEIFSDKIETNKRKKYIISFFLIIILLLFSFFIYKKLRIQAEQKYVLAQLKDSYEKVINNSEINGSRQTEHYYYFNSKMAGVDVNNKFSGDYTKSKIYQILDFHLNCTNFLYVKTCQYNYNESVISKDFELNNKKGASHIFYNKNSGKLTSETFYYNIDDYFIIKSFKENPLLLLKIGDSLLKMQQKYSFENVSKPVCATFKTTGNINETIEISGKLIKYYIENFNLTKMDTTPESVKINGLVNNPNIGNSEVCFE